MNILEIATNRKTSRFFKPDKVKEEDIKYILETARQAPSGSNKQPWRFIIITSLEQKKRIRAASEKGEKIFYESLSDERKVWYVERGLSPCKKLLTQAPILIIFLGDTTAPNYKPSIWVSIAYAILAIEERGLATVTYTPSNPIHVNKIVEAPTDFIVEAILPIGYSCDSKPKEKRIDLSKLTYQNKWGNPYKFDLF